MTQTFLRLATCLIAVAVALSACAVERARTAHRAQQTMQGMAKKEVLACMGEPDRRTRAEELEQWTYSRSDAPGDIGAVGVQPDLGNGYRERTTTTARGRYCVATITFRGENVSSVRYSGQTGGIVTRDEQCAFLVEACVK